MTEFIDYWQRYDEDEITIKKQQRNERIDKRKRAKESFMKLNGRGLITDILPLLEKKSKTKKR